MTITLGKFSKDKNDLFDIMNDIVLCIFHGFFFFFSKFSLIFFINNIFSKSKKFIYFLLSSIWQLYLISYTLFRLP